MSCTNIVRERVCECAYEFIEGLANPEHSEGFGADRVMWSVLPHLPSVMRKRATDGSFPTLLTASAASLVRNAL
jgi:hypothetical protein